MSYTKHIYNLGNAIEVEEKHTYRLRAPGMKREKKRKLTPAQMKAVNQKNKEKRCRRRLRKYFRENGVIIDLAYFNIRINNQWMNTINFQCPVTCKANISETGGYMNTQSQTACRRTSFQHGGS